MTGNFVSQEKVDKFLKNIKEIVEENKTLKLELTKYKRAFEIIKKYKMIYDLTDFEVLDEEYELLEELMGNE